MYRRYFLVALLTVLLIGGLGSLVSAQFSGSGESPTSTFEFGLIGDLPYTPEEDAKFPRLVEEMNKSRLAFVVHDGDIKSGSAPCDDKTFFQRRDLFQSFEPPFILIPGDNEWTDCHREDSGNYDPVERLAKLREIFFQDDQSLGRRTLRLTRQSEVPQYSKFRENVRWTYGNVMFVGLNVTGSNNNFGRTREADAEYRERNAADLVWLREGFAEAKRSQSRGIMLVIQANPGFELPSDDENRTGFNDFLASLEAETLAFEKPVVLVHGDSHYFRIDKPLRSTKSKRRLENFTRVETFGTPDVHWLRASVNPEDPNLFRFEQEIVEANLVNHRS